MKKLFFAILGLVAAGCILSSCLGSDVEDYQEWREQNDRWLDTVDLSEYNKVNPADYPSIRVMPIGRIEQLIKFCFA